MTASMLPPGLMLVHGNHAESLRDVLVTWTTRHPLAPLETEVVLVHSNGVAQWLKLALAADPAEEGGGCGIAAALEFLLPSRFMWQVYRAVLGREAVPETSPFDESRLVWRLVRMLPAVMDEPDFQPLGRFLQSDGDQRKRFQLAERLADLYDQYQVYRADWLAAWAAGENVLIDGRGVRTALADEDRWQAALWRRLLADVAREGGDDAASQGGRAGIHAAFVVRAQAWSGPRPPGLPRRVLVFGISSLPRQSLEVLATIAQWSQVVMCVHNPCEHYWADIVAGKDLLRAREARQTRRSGHPDVLADDAMHLHAHPLLAAWGKQGRDFIALLDEHDSDVSRADYRTHFHAIGQRIDLFTSYGGETLLQQLQDDIRDLRPLPETCTHWSAVDPARDASVRFHVAHGSQREVEILHDQLLAAFAADRTLRPRDVIVMVPDIDTYAPHIQAVFGLLDVDDPRHIPFTVADQGQRRFDPLVHALEILLALPRSRMAASDLLDLLEVPALRRRFGIAAEDVPLLHRWIRGANIRWGLHDEQRASLDLPAAGEAAPPNTWLFGLRRMLLGYAAGGAASWQDIEPYAEIGGLEAALLGPLVQLVTRLDEAWRALRTPATASQWCERLRRLIADFFDADDGTDAYTLMRLEQSLQRWSDACDEAAFTETLPLAVVGEYWLSSLDERGLSQRFFAGAVTFATLMPMRAIPFRHVCLLGMNDGDYPRSRTPMDFDLMGRDYRPGDRSRREDDRCLFLEALLSARDRLYISWVGRSINDNTERPPSVLVGQLRDHLAAGWRLAETAPASADAHKARRSPLLDALTIEHPLQPFSPKYFSAEPEKSPLFSYAYEWCPDIQAADPPAATAVLAPIQRDEPLTLRELADFLKDPVKAFFRHRLGVAFEIEDPASDDIEPFALDGLSKWKLQDELIQAQLQALTKGEDYVAVRNASVAGIGRRGELAPGVFGRRMAESLVEPMGELFDAYLAALARWPNPAESEAEVRFEAAIDRQVVELADWLGGVRSNEDGQRGRVVLESSDVVKDGAYRGDKLIRHWVAHLAGHLAGAPLTTLVVSKVGSVELLPLEISEAKAHLIELLGAWREGMRRPLPLAAKTAFAYLKAIPDPDVVEGPEGPEGPEGAQRLQKAVDAARTAYEGDGYNHDGELGESVYLQRAWPSFDALTSSGEFDPLAEALLRPLQSAIHAKAAAGRVRKGAQA